jgi:antirestriction protein ArdC
MKKNSIKDEFAELVEKLIEKMETSDKTWIKSWSVSHADNLQNFVSKKAYRGANIFFLQMLMMERGHEAPFFMSFKQAQEKGGKVKKGAKGYPVYFFKILNKTVTMEDIKTGKNVEESINFPLLNKYVVFNIEDIEGIDYELPVIEKPNENQKIERAEQFIKNTNLKLKHGGNRAFYKPVFDYVQMPLLETFTDSNNYYSTLLHELTHWTGAADRVDRQKGKKFGDKQYAIEELIAEIGSAFLCSHLNIEIEECQHPEYLKSWCNSLRENPMILWKVASSAQKAFDYLLNLQLNEMAVA